MKPRLAMPRPLRVWSGRSPRGTRLWWYARCNLCDAPIHPYGVSPGSVFAGPDDAGDEARTHLVQKHPTHPLVR